jgi:antitoxin VapB
MNDQDNRLREARQSFTVETSQAPVAKSYRAKVFKSGNSLALRLPAELGLEAGMEMNLQVLEGGGYALTRADAPRRKIDVSGFAGKCPWLKPLPRELREFDDSPRDWHLLDRAQDTSEQ